MSERRFALVDFTHMSRVGCLRLYEVGHIYVLSRAIAHAATKRGLVAKQRPPRWTPPGMFRLPEVLTEAEVVEAEAELRALRHRTNQNHLKTFPNAHATRMIVSIHRRNKHAPQHIDRERAGVRLEAERAEPEARGKRLIALFGAAPHSLFERF